MKNLAFRCLRVLFSFAIVSFAPANAQGPPQGSSVPQQGARVAFASSQDLTQRFDIFEINADGSGLRLLTHHQKPYWNWNCCPAWSPDGKELAFVSSAAPSFGASHAGIFIEELAGGNVITGLSLSSPLLCPSVRRERGFCYAAKLRSLAQDLCASFDYSRTDRPKFLSVDGLHNSKRIYANCLHDRGQIAGP